MVYHRRPLGEKDPNHRVTCIDRMEFDENGRIKQVIITTGCQKKYIILNETVHI